MSTKIKTLIGIFATILIGFSSCQEDDYSLGDLSAPTNLTITADIVGKSATFPNGDGSGKVNFTFSANNAISYKVDFGDGSAAKVYSATETKKYNKVGSKNYRVIVTALGKGGITTTAIEEIEVYYAYDIDPSIVTLLTGDSVTGKKWRIDNTLSDNIGNGPGDGRLDTNDETFMPSWWTAGPNGRADKGIYNDVFTFTNTKVFTHKTGGDLYGTKAFFAIDFDPETPGVYGGYGDEWILSYPDYSETFDYDGDLKGPDGSQAVYLTFAQKGHLGYFSGSHRFMILDITETTMWLRCTMPGTNISAWYVRLIAI
ncbi:MAG: PKD domain-containing protein [Lutibacter sp.]